MNIFTLSAVILFLGACASQKQTAPASQASEPQQELQVKLKESDHKSFTGKNIFIFIPKDFINSKSIEDYPGLQTELEKVLIARGFNLVKSPRHAHTLLYVSLQKYRWINEEWVFASELAKRDMKQLFLERIYLSTSIQDYGKRPLTGPSVRIAAFSDQWNDLYPKFLASLPDYLDSIGLKVPSANKSMKGDPGCVPRFGLDYSYKSFGDKQKIIVTKVIPQGPAFKAGIKQGDEVLSVDSVALTDGFNNPDLTDVYEKSIPVPVKFQRGDKIMRSTLKSAIECNNDESYQ